MKEYYVMRSKYKTNGHYNNELTYSPEVSLKKSSKGTYRFYHKGKLIWERSGNNKLYNDCMDGTFYDMDFEEELDNYPIFKEYDASVDAMN